MRQERLQFVKEAEGKLFATVSGFYALEHESGQAQQAEER